jgi:EmrB/QacA subfamily drug resistance transporter
MELLYARKWRIFGVMMIGWAMSLIDISIVNIAIPEIQRDMSTTTTSASWVINAYNIVFAVLLISMGRLADQFGRRRFFVIGMAVFTLGSAACAFAWTIEALSWFRVIQGAGAGILAPLGFAITALVFPPEERGKGIALIAVVALVSTAVGPVLGGAILEIADWNWIFAVNVPFGVLGIVLALRWWPETYDLTAGRSIDWVGMLLLGGAVFSGTFALAEANARGWDDAVILWLLQLSVLLGIAFFLSQRYVKSPMLPPALMRNRQFSAANATMVLFAAGALGALFMLSLVFQNLWGLEYWEAALALLPVPLTGIIVFPRVVRGADSRAPGQLAVPALYVMAAGLVWFSFVPSTFESWWDYLIVAPGVAMIGVGIGTVFPTTNVGAMGAVSGPELGLASGVVNTSRQLGSALGIALLVATVITASDFTLDFASEDVQDANEAASLPPAMAQGILMRSFGDFVGRTPARHDIAPGFEEQIAREAAGAARDGYGWAFRIAALAVLAAVPFARRMTRHPGEARAADAAARAAAAGGPGADAEPDAGRALDAGRAPDASRPATTEIESIGDERAVPPAVEARIAELESSLDGLRSQLADGDGHGPVPAKTDEGTEQDERAPTESDRVTAEQDGHAPTESEHATAEPEGHTPAESDRVAEGDDGAATTNGVDGSPRGLDDLAADLGPSGTHERRPPLEEDDPPVRRRRGRLRRGSRS